MGHRPFLKRYLKRDEILASITFCDALLNDALGMFGVSKHHVALCSRLFNMLHLVAFYPNPYTQDYPSQRVASTKGNRGFTRVALTPSRSYAPPTSLHRATSCSILPSYGPSKCPKVPQGFESRPERARSRPRHCRLTAAHAYRPRPK